MGYVIKDEFNDGTSLLFVLGTQVIGLIQIEAVDNFGRVQQARGRVRIPQYLAPGIAPRGQLMGRQAQRRHNVKVGTVQERRSYDGTAGCVKVQIHPGSFRRRIRVIGLVDFDLKNEGKRWNEKQRQEKARVQIYENALHPRQLEKTPLSFTRTVVETILYNHPRSVDPSDKTWTPKFWVST